MRVVYKKLIAATITVLIVWFLYPVYIGYSVFPINTNPATRTEPVNNLYEQVAKDSEESYYIALRSGNTMDAYLQAGIIAQSYLQAKNEAAYIYWDNIHKDLAKKLGL